MATISRMLGRQAFRPGSTLGWSDLGRSKTILFWEIK
ncbi:hypothetical protein [Paraburkholderia bryophila]